MTDQTDILRVSPPLPRMRRLSPSRVVLHAPAKINLNLLVGPRRDDGYHGLDSIVARVSLYDRIELRARDDGQVVLACAGFDCGPAERNLAHLAAEAMRRAAGAPRGADIRLDKRIGPGRGLGGGSSDAAAVLEGLNDLWRLRLPPERLGEMAASLGSDVPLFLGPATARMTGRGEILAPVEVHPFSAILVLAPRLACATREVYRAFDERPAPPERQLPPETFRGPPSAWRGRLVNHLANAACRVCPPLGEVIETLRRATGLPVHVTGSGSGLFVLCDDSGEAQAVAAHMPSSLRECSLIVEPA